MGSRRARLAALLGLLLWAASATAQRDLSLPEPGERGSIEANMLRTVTVPPADNAICAYESTPPSNKRNLQWLTLNGTDFAVTGSEITNGSTTCEVCDGGAVGAQASDFSNPTTFGANTYSTTGPWTFSSGASCTFASGSTFTLASGATNAVTLTECVMLDASAIVPPSSAACARATTHGTNFSYQVCAFDTGATEESGYFTFELPNNLSGTTASVSFTWVSNNAACNAGTDDDVCWAIDGDSFADDAAWNSGSLGATAVAVTDRCLANGDIMKTSAVTLTHSMVTGERAAVRVYRDTDGTACAGGTADDDYAQDAELLAVRFCYTIDTLGSGD